MDIGLSIVVPCYNESKNLAKVLEAFAEALAGRDGIELILVDNGSRDDTPDQLRRLLDGGRYPFARSVRVEVNQGYGWGIMTGLRHARGEFLAWTHADMQTPPADVLRGYDRILAMTNPASSLVCAYRVGRPIFDQLFTWAMGCIASIALKSRLSHVNAQPKLFHRSFMAELANAPKDFTLDLFLLHRANQAGLDVCRVPVRFDRRTAGEAKGGGSLIGKYRLSKRTLGQIRELRRSLADGRVGGKALPSVETARRAA